ncbi:MAG: outer membrane protein assembly factor BamD [Arenimonas sp.]
MIRFSAAFRFLLIVSLALGLSSCKTVGKWFGKDKEEKTETLPVEEMYSVAKKDMDRQNYSRAQTYYQRLTSRFPFGAYSEQAQLELAYVQYKQGLREDASSTITRFIRTYPTHPHIDYAYYLKAVINFEQRNALFARITRMDMSARDLGAPTQSFNDFNEVARRFPNSPYAADSVKRMIYLRNLLARYELNVGMYYLRRGAYVAAAGRGKYLVETYPQSEYQGDALALMAVSYDAVGQKTLAEDAKKVLQASHPDHPYLVGKWPRKKGLFRQLNPFAGEYK